MNWEYAENFIAQHLHTGGNCLQGCGRAVPRNRSFCSAECLSNYDLKTWGEGPVAPEVLVPILRASLRVARGGRTK